MKLLVKIFTWSVPIVLFCLSVNNVSAVVEGGSTAASSSDMLSDGEQEEREVDKFQYKFEDRPDPFLPFLSKDSGRDDTDDTPMDEGRGAVLTGMQLFEPGQLKLVALLKIGNKNIAMAEDVTGKGYRLDENMLIGRHGTIHRITEEEVEITETYTTKTGRVITKEIIMRLKKEGDK